MPVLQVGQGFVSVLINLAEATSSGLHVCCSTVVLTESSKVVLTEPSNGEPFLIRQLHSLQVE